MDFRTEIFPDPAPFKISLRSHQVFVGSCFTENMSSRLSALGLPVTVNPHGILFNPVSVARCVGDLVDGKRYTLEDLDKFDSKYLSYFHHGSFSNVDSEAALEEINLSIEQGREALKKAQTLFITFGSSWAYRHREKNVIVANCHKVPQSTFDKELITHDKTVLLFGNLLEKVFEFNKQIRVVFTVSPVRHRKDGFTENQLSKSHLTIAVHNLKSIFERAHYFPAYEILMDDLRDYRFYKSDLLHPNEQAQQYVWEKFQQTFFTDPDREKIKKIEKINRSLGHVSEESDDEAFKKWRAELKEEKDALLSAQK